MRHGYLDGGRLGRDNIQLAFKPLDALREVAHKCFECLKVALRTIHWSPCEISRGIICETEGSYTPFSRG